MKFKFQQWMGGARAPSLGPKPSGPTALGVVNPTPGQHIPGTPTVCVDILRRAVGYASYCWRGRRAPREQRRLRGPRGQGHITA